MRPPRPVPLIFEGSKLCSVTSRRTAGLSSSVSCWTAASSPFASADSAACSSSDSSATAPASSIPRISSAVTVSPASLSMLFRTPSVGAGTSRTTLSVSRSTRFSSRRTLSPGCLCHVATTASETDSGNTGTLISVLIYKLLHTCFCTLADGECLIDQSFLLFYVSCKMTYSG